MISLFILLLSEGPCSKFEALPGGRTYQEKCLVHENKSFNYFNMIPFRHGVWWRSLGRGAVVRTTKNTKHDAEVRRARDLVYGGASKPPHPAV